MKIILEPISGTPQANLKLAKSEMKRYLRHSGIVKSVKALSNTIEVIFIRYPEFAWPKDEVDIEVAQTKKGITTNLRTSFKVVSVADTQDSLKWILSSKEKETIRGVLQTLGGGCFAGGFVALFAGFHWVAACILIGIGIVLFMSCAFFVPHRFG